MMAPGTVTIDWGGKLLVMRRPTVQEFDLGLAVRLCAQVSQHGHAIDAIAPSAEAPLQIDRLWQLRARALEALLVRVRACVGACGLTVGGEPLDAERLPAVDDAGLDVWTSAALGLLGALGVLGGDADAGKSRPLSA